MGREQEEEGDTGKGEEDFVSKPVPLGEMHVCSIQTQPKPLGDQAVSHQSEKHGGGKASCPRQHRCIKRFLARKPEHKQM